MARRVHLNSLELLIKRKTLYFLTEINLGIFLCDFYKYCILYPIVFIYTIVKFCWLLFASSFLVSGAFLAGLFCLFMFVFAVIPIMGTIINIAMIFGLVIIRAIF